MKDRRLLILTAMTLEADAVRRALRRSRHRLPDWKLAVIGIGAVRLSRLHWPQIQGVILAGVAGALDPKLHVGDIVVDDRSHPLPKLPNAKIGLFHTAQGLIATPLEKHKLHEATHALAVEMEHDPVARHAQRHSIPFAHVRSISDTTQHILDPAVLQLVDDLGRPKPLAIAQMLLTRPRMIGYLRELGRNSAVAAESMADAVVQMLRDGWPNNSSSGPT